MVYHNYNKLSWTFFPLSWIKKDPYFEHWHTYSAYHDSSQSIKVYTNTIILIHINTPPNSIYVPYNTYAQPYQNIFLTSIEVVNAIILFIRRFALNKLLPNESSYWTGSAFNWKYSEIKFFISCFPLPSLSTTHSPVFPILFYIILKHIGSWDESCKH